MGTATAFTNLTEDILGSFNTRVNFLGQNVADTHKIIADTHRFLSHVRKHHKAMGNKLRATLGTFVSDLSEGVADLRKRFQTQQKANHQECKANHQAWHKMSNTMAAKRRNFHASLKASTQKAEHKS